MSDFAFSPWPQYGAEEIAAVTRVLESGKTSQWGGREVRAFEQEFAHWIGAADAVAVANGSVALEIAWRCIDLQLGDEVILSPRTFVASAFSIVLCSGIPVFVDVDPTTQNIDPSCIESAITPATKAILCIHHEGCPCEMDPILEIAARHNLYVVEDCAQAHGARYRGRNVGTIGDIGCYSFCQDKIFTAGGEGGMVICRSDEMMRRAWSFKDHGRNREKIASLTWQPSFPYFCDSVGTNLRMTEIQAAIGRSFLKKADEWIRIRRQNAQIMDQCLRQFPFIRVPEYPSHMEHSFYEYYAFVVPECLPTGWSHGRILQEFRNLGLPCNVGSCPEVYLEEAFKEAKYADGTVRCLQPAERLKVARHLGETSLKFLIHPGLSGEGMDYISQSIERVLGEAI